jgi:hypothetical protein
LRVRPAVAPRQGSWFAAAIAAGGAGAVDSLFSSRHGPQNGTTDGRVLPYSFTCLSVRRSLRVPLAVPERWATRSRTRHIWVAFLLVPLVGCGASRTVTRSIRRSPEMVAVVLKAAPPGTPIEEAARFMRGEGFRCSTCVSDSFMDRSEIDFLYCTRSDGGSAARRKWKVAIIHKRGVVTEVLANTGLVGP